MALFSETVKGIIQAETFLLHERGFASEQDYEHKWMNFYSGGFIVEEADGVLLRTPDLVCRESAALLANLHGINLRRIAKKELAGILGKGQGCVHVIDLVCDCAQILELYD